MKSRRDPHSWPLKLHSGIIRPSPARYRYRYRYVFSIIMFEENSISQSSYLPRTKNPACAFYFLLHAQTLLNTAQWRCLYIVTEEDTHTKSMQTRRVLIWKHKKWHQFRTIIFLNGRLSPNVLPSNEQRLNESIQPTACLLALVSAARWQQNTCFPPDLPTEGEKQNKCCIKITIKREEKHFHLQ